MKLAAVCSLVALVVFSVTCAVQAVDCPFHEYTAAVSALSNGDIQIQLLNLNFSKPLSKADLHYRWTGSASWQENKNMKVLVMNTRFEHTLSSNELSANADTLTFAFTLHFVSGVSCDTSPFTLDMKAARQQISNLSTYGSANVSAALPVTAVPSASAPVAPTQVQPVLEFPGAANITSTVTGIVGGVLGSIFPGAPTAPAAPAVPSAANQTTPSLPVVCPAGSIYAPRLGTCVTLPTPPSCPTGTYYSAFYRSCIPVPSTTTTCPPGTVLIGNQCVLVTSTTTTSTCPTGTILVGNQCLATTSTTTTPSGSVVYTCPLGYVYSAASNLCVPSALPSASTVSTSVLTDRGCTCQALWSFNNQIQQGCGNMIYQGRNWCYVNQECATALTGLTGLKYDFCTRATTGTP